MQYSTLFISLLLGATGINAAPSEISARRPTISVTIFNGDSCGGERPPKTELGKFNIPTTGDCFKIQTTVTDPRDSVRLDIPSQSLGAGCEIRFYFNDTCDSVNYLPFTGRENNHQCSTFGNSNHIRSAKTFGTC